MYNPAKRKRDNAILKLLLFVLPVIPFLLGAGLVLNDLSFIRQKEPTEYTTRQIIQRPAGGDMYAELTEGCFENVHYVRTKDSDHTYYYLLRDCEDSLAATFSLVLISDRELGDEIGHSSIIGQLSRGGLDTQVEQYINQDNLLEQDYQILYIGRTPRWQLLTDLGIAAVVLGIMGVLMGVIVLSLRQRKKFDAAMAVYIDQNKENRVG